MNARTSKLLNKMFRNDPAKLKLAKKMWNGYSDAQKHSNRLQLLAVIKEAGENGVAK